MQPESEPLSAARETAAAWYDRLNRDKVSDETRSEFARWLTQSSENERLYNAAKEAWSHLQKSAEDPRILALRHETALRLTRRTSRRVLPIRWAAAALVILGTAAILMATAPHSMPEQTTVARLVDWVKGSHANRYATAVGERLAVTLADGSQVTLDTDSELQVNFTKTERGVRLARGQAFFEVAKDRDRPFVVDTQNRRFVAVGTAFDVRLDGELVKVTMVEGVVRVERQDLPGSAAMPGSAVVKESSQTSLSLVATIRAGEQLTTDAARQDHVRPIDPDRTTSWRRGQIIFENTRLADAVAELNRYSESKIELADPALNELRLSGGFATGRPTLFVEAITNYFPISVTRADDRSVVLSVKK